MSTFAQFRVLVRSFFKITTFNFSAFYIYITVLCNGHGPWHISSLLKLILTCSSGMVLNPENNTGWFFDWHPLPQKV